MEITTTGAVSSCGSPKGRRPPPVVNDLLKGALAAVGAAENGVEEVRTTTHVDESGRGGGVRGEVGFGERVVNNGQDPKWDCHDI